MNTETKTHMSENAETGEGDLLRVFLRVSGAEEASSYGAVVRDGHTRWGFGARCPGTTFNAVEIIGATEVLNAIRERRGPSNLDVIGSSYLAANAKRIPIWRAQQWKCSPFALEGNDSEDAADDNEQSRADIINPELWASLEEAMVKHVRVVIRFLPSTGRGGRYWHRDRTTARAIAKHHDVGSFVWSDLSAVFGTHLDLSKLSLPANDNGTGSSNSSTSSDSEE
jgi:ribonuclease HI